MALSYSNKNKSKRIGEVLKTATLLLQEIGIDNPNLDARLLMEQALSCSNLELLLGLKETLNKNQIEQFYTLLSRRLAFEPIAYINGKKEFYGYEFIVSKDCLIPRPDSETVIECCLSMLKDFHEATIYDIGTGSGALSLTLLKEHEGLNAIATDICEKALFIAKKNAENLSVTSRVKFLQGDLFAPCVKEPLANLIVSNPPYIASGDLKNLSPDVKNYEPHLALTPGDEHGMLMYRRIIASAPDFLLPGGFLVLEIGFNQGDMVLALAKEAFTVIGLFRDLANNPRVVVLKKNGNAYYRG